MNGQFYYTYKDYLGSLLAVTDSDGDVVGEQSFDAWGRYRDPETWQVLNSDPSDNQLAVDMPVWMCRGYTGHEHLPQFELVNMNGRMYDPKQARMLAVDNFVQNPFSTQAYNRYTYAANNPLKYVDPNGEEIVSAVIAGAMIGAFIGAVTAGLSGATPGEIMLGMLIGGGAGAASGAASGAVSAALGTTGFIAGAASGAAGGFTGGFISGSHNSWLNGSSFEDGLLDGLKAGGIGAAVGGAIGGVVGGIDAANHGGDFWTGKGATYYNFTGSGAQGVEGTPENYNNEYLNDFTNGNFTNAAQLRKNVITINASSGPDATFTETGHFEISSGPHVGKNAWGYAKNLGVTKGYDIFISKAAFSSNQRLYLTLGHELLHVSYAYSGLSLSDNAEHASIYNWQFQQAKKFYLAGSYRDQMNLFKPFLNTENDLIWYNLIPIRPGTSFTW